MFGFNFAPTGWAQCNGQLLPISQNTALFSLLGTMYGGDGKSTFGLPDLEGSAPIHFGQGPGLSDRVEGETAGEPFVTLIQSELPSHGHQLGAGTATGTSATPAPVRRSWRLFPGPRIRRRASFACSSRPSAATTPSISRTPRSW